MTVVDIDEPTTWPSAVMDWTSAYAEKLRGSTEYTSDLQVPLGQEDEFRLLFSGHRVRAFHCTRLFDHEVAAIRRQGLRMLSLDLIDERIAEAHRRGLLTDIQQEGFRSRNVFANGRAKNERREGQVCFVLGRTMFSEPCNGCEPLLGAWGGEGLNGGPLGQPGNLVAGVPTIVVAQIDLSVSHRSSPTFPTLGNMFVGALLGLDDVGADVFLRSPVQPEDVLDVWQPGHAEYDRHNGLPRP